MNNTIRITTGIAKNKRLKTPDIEGFRAVQEIAKSSLFSILGEKINDAVCMDLFAGSGNLGLEALSRGASWCDFIDESPTATRTITENVKNCGFEEKSEVTRKDAVKYVGNSYRNYDVVFIDPFYKDTSHKFLFENIQNILNQDAVVIFFHSPETNIEEMLSNSQLRVVDQRKFGKSAFSIIKP